MPYTPIGDLPFATQLGTGSREAGVWVRQPSGIYLFDKEGFVPRDARIVFEDRYLYGSTVYFTANDTFAYADYPLLRAIRVRMVAGGGAGGGAATTAAGASSTGEGGGGGAYAEAFILVGDLDAEEAVTVGQGGTGVAGAAGNDGTDSVFDTISGEVRADAGQGGVVRGTTATIVWQDAANGGTGGGSTGDFKVAGGGGFGAFASPTQSRGGTGGGSFFSPRGPQAPNGNNSNGNNGSAYGEGGSGANNVASQAVTRTGGDGADGIVIVDLFY